MSSFFLYDRSDSCFAAVASKVTFMEANISIMVNLLKTRHTVTVNSTKNLMIHSAIFTEVVGSPVDLSLTALCVDKSCKALCWPLSSKGSSIVV